MSISDKSQLSSDDNAVQPLQLRPMSPKYDENQHKRYVKRLMNALYDQNCKSVALSGSYGSGKSSILEQFVKEANGAGHFVAKVSLATFNAELYQQSNNDESPLTALLEREILGQLLYQGDPKKAPKSSFNQIHNTTPWRKGLNTLVMSLAIFSVIIFVFLMQSYSSNDLKNLISTLLNGDKDAAHYSFMTLAGAAIIIFFLISLVCSYALSFIDKTHLKSISASGFSLTVSDGENDSSYFNKYRDELIYLFEANNYDTVIFEDIDRFDDLGIFDELRKLNETLNLAPGIVGKKGDKIVRFIYAVKDSIFVPANEFDAGSKEVLGSGRVKFFDIIISVVPFISMFNANEMAAKEFESELEDAKSTKEGQRFSDLLLLAAPYIADMRLIISIHNDYQVMVQEMGSPSFDKPSPLGLTCTGILAIAIHKNLYPLEYEDLRIHKGKLNELYDIHQGGINRLLPGLLSVKSMCERCKQSDCVPDDVAEILGKILEEALDKRTVNIRCITLCSVAYYLNKNETNNIFSSRFWDRFFEIEPGECVYIGHNNGSGYPGIGLTKSEFLNLLNLVFPDAEIYRFMQNGPLDAVVRLASEIELIRTADFSTRPDLLCPASVTAKEEHMEPFASIVKRTVGDGIVSELILGGFIGKDFDLYISKYPSDAKPHAVNFVYHCYERGVQDLDYALNNDDCCAVLNIIPTNHLAQPCCFNRYLFSYILDRKDQGLSTVAQGAIVAMVDGIIENFSSSGKQLIKRLLEDYPNNRTHAHRFISTLLERTDRAFDILVDSSIDSCSLQSQRELMSYAFTNMNPDISYTYESSSSWLSNNIESLSIPRVAEDEVGTNAIAKYINRCSISIHNLSALGDRLGMAVVNFENYDVTRANLLFACKTSGLPTLDTLEEVYPVVYEKVTSSEAALASYLNAMEPQEHSATQFAPFVFSGLCRRVATWQFSADIDNLARTIVERIKPDTEAVNLDDFYPINSGDKLNVMGRALIRELILNQRVARTYRNACYILKLEDFDKAIYERSLFDRFLSQGSISEMHNDLSNNSLDVDELARGLLYRAHLTSDDLIFIMPKLKGIREDSFPIKVDSSTIGEINCDKPTIVKLAEHDLIAPLNVIYDHLDGGNWNSRRKILKKLLHENPPKAWDALPTLYACDLPRIVAAAKSWGSWLAKDIASDPEYYIDRCREDDSEKNRVRLEIDEKAKSVGLLSS